MISRSARADRRAVLRDCGASAGSLCSASAPCRPALDRPLLSFATLISNRRSLVRSMIASPSIHLPRPPLFRHLSARNTFFFRSRPGPLSLGSRRRRISSSNISTLNNEKLQEATKTQARRCTCRTYQKFNDIAPSSISLPSSAICNRSPDQPQHFPSTLLLSAAGQLNGLSSEGKMCFFCVL